MITLQDLEEAIAECEGQRKPGANTCLKLAAFYTIKNHLYPEEKTPLVYQSMGAYHDSRQPERIELDSNSEFARLVNGRKASEVLPVVDELIEALMAINPRLYKSFIRKIE